MSVGLGIRVAARDNPALLYNSIRALSSASAVAPDASVAPALAAAAASGEGGRKADRRGLPRWIPAAAAAAATAAAAVMAGGGLTVSGDTPAGHGAAASGPSNQAAAARELEEWLKAQGADVSKVQIKPSQAGPGAGLGLFATAAVSAPRHGAPWWSWLWPRRGGGGGGGPREPTTLAAFPLAAAITARKACQDPQLGEQFSWMLDRQLLDERTAVMVYLLVERLRGEQSAYAPWIRALPQSFDVPITFSPADLAHLRGTTLGKAVEAVARRMRDTWSRLEAPLGGLCRDLGLRRPTWDDWVWAYCVWWSRGQSLPVPESGSATKALASLSASNGNGSGAGSGAGAGRKVNVEVVEGLVPGLDFANHRDVPPPQCWWEVVAPERPHAKDAAGGSVGLAPSSSSGAAAAATADATMVRLQLHAGAAVRPGQELFISYGDKSNEELLMLYGFATPGNPHEYLMLYCPLPPQAEWDDVMHARMELLQAYGLRPQFFLPHPDSVAGPAADGLASSSGGSSSSSKSSKKQSSGKAAAADGAASATGSGAGASAAEADEAAAAASQPPLVLPGDVLDTLEVFVLNFQELAHRSKTLQSQMEEHRAARAAGSPLAAVAQHSPVLDLAALRSRMPRLGVPELRHYLASLGLRMATLTAFIRLLEIKVVELEGEAEGTGSLEQDEALFARLDAEAAASLDKDAPGKLVYPQPPGEQQQQQQQQQQQGQERKRRLRAALVYRMGQKQLARAWLVRAKAELTNLLALMRDMEARCSSLERAKK
ncbi:hypothetical protein HYH02_004954 [Chlamydomonas schloesseri]|uniref:SET domain-containing protein n=1 Tax=Chlamydomonas schloesseri TaxID=2026947 RepID=A0A835WN72_9CHLO|nr:hypothetical protein HYH02_004954 [Chlamydomonas schloesseri]|eukprot:KAG2450452.1 hypothetical protein HYH02_004954 [Chlamydomonas schloesseri]